MKLFKRLMIIQVFAVLFFFYSEGAFSRDITIPPSGPKEFTVFKLNLKSVDFLGTGNHILMKQGNDEWTNDKFVNYDNDGDGVVDDVDVKIDYAEWQDSNLDGNAEKNEPTCYTKGTAPGMTAVFAISPSLTESVNAKLQIKNGSTILVIKDVELSGKEITVKGLTWGTGLPKNIKKSTCALPNNVENSTYTLNWEISFDGGATYSDIGSTATNFFVVYDTPQGSTLTAKRMDWATNVVANCEEREEQAMRKRIAECIHRALSKNPPNDPDSNNTAPKFVSGWELLDGKKPGMCFHQAELMKLAVQLLGIQQAKTSKVYASTDMRECDKYEYQIPPVCSEDPEPRLLQFHEDAPRKYWMHHWESVCVVDNHYYAVWPSVDADSHCAILKELVDKGKVIAQHYCFKNSVEVEEEVDEEKIKVKKEFWDPCKPDSSPKFPWEP